MTYASDLIECAHCGSPITGERKTKMTKSGERDYIYYRCTQYHKGDHPRIRLTERQLDSQMLAIFDSLRVEDDEFRDTFREQLRQATNWDERTSATRAKQLQCELVQVRDQQNRLLNLRMLEEINADTFAAKNRELRDRTAELQLEIEACDRGRNETIDIAVKAFELSQSLRAKWVTADCAAKRRILEIVCLNCSLDDVDLCATMRKPFDLLAKGLVSKDSRGDWIRTSDLLTPSQTVLRYFTEFGGCLCFGATVVLLFEATWFTFFPGQIATLIFDFGTRKITSPSGVLASLGGVAALGALKRRELRRPCEVLSCHFATGVQKGPPKLFIVRDSRS